MKYIPQSTQQLRADGARQSLGGCRQYRVEVEESRTTEFFQVTNPERRGLSV